VIKSVMYPCRSTGFVFSYKSGSPSMFLWV
jgi:hypothetical protein